jgi:hypothetical protein
LPQCTPIQHNNKIFLNEHNTTHKQNQGQKPHHINKCRKSIDKIQHPFMIKALKKRGIKDTFLNIIKAIYDKLIDNILNGKN